MRENALNKSSGQLEKTIRRVCELDVQALKPGNVSVYAAGHGMRADDFLESARVTAPVMARVDCSVGERILASIQATQQAVGCNTNLGIVLLLAPLVQAYYVDAAETPLRGRLKSVLDGLSREDANAAFEAIRIAAPGGLGGAEKYDVRDAAPAVTLLEAMRAAQDRDRIAGQYARAYTDIFEQVLPWLRSYLRRWQSAAWALTGCYLEIAAAWPDTHVQRKHGEDCAQAVCEQMRSVEKAFKACENPESTVPVLLQLDAQLKRGGINPGTSADLAVAGLLVACLDEFFLDGSEDPEAWLSGLS